MNRFGPCGFNCDNDIGDVLKKIAGKHSKSCFHCIHGFPKEEDLTNHLKCFKSCRDCSDCIAGFFREARLERHLFRHVKDTPTRQPPSRKRRKIKAKDKHSNSSVGSDTSEYSDRPKKTARLDNLHDTISKSDSKPYGSMKSKPMVCVPKFAKGKPIKCNICDKVFKRLDYLKEHLYSHEGSGPFKCGQCKEYFRRPFHVVDHYQNVHNRKIDKSLFYRDKTDGCITVRVTIEETSVSKDNLCPPCGEFETTQTHKYIAEDDKDKSVSKRNATTPHNPNVWVQKYDKGKPFRCKICKRRFRRRDYLREHLYTHKGGGPFKCGPCKMYFRRPFQLVDHYQNVHKRKIDKGLFYRETADGCMTVREISKNTSNSEEKDKSDSTQNDSIINNHKVSLPKSASAKPLKCNICGKVWKTQKDLSAHLDAHKKIRPFKCVPCKMYFRKPFSLVNHYQNVHKRLVDKSLFYHDEADGCTAVKETTQNTPDSEDRFSGLCPLCGGLEASQGHKCIPEEKIDKIMKTSKKTFVKVEHTPITGKNDVSVLFDEAQLEQSITPTEKAASKPSESGKKNQDKTGNGKGDLASVSETLPVIQNTFSLNPILQVEKNHSKVDKSNVPKSKNQNLRLIRKPTKQQQQIQTMYVPNSQITNYFMCPVCRKIIISLDDVRQHAEVCRNTTVCQLIPRPLNVVTNTSNILRPLAVLDPSPIQQDITTVPLLIRNIATPILAPEDQTVNNPNQANMFSNASNTLVNDEVIQVIEPRTIPVVGDFSTSVSEGNILQSQNRTNEGHNNVIVIEPEEPHINNYGSNHIQPQTSEQDDIQSTRNKGVRGSTNFVSTDPYNLLLDDVITPERYETSAVGTLDENSQDQHSTASSLALGSGTEEGQFTGAPTLGPANPLAPNETSDEQSMQKASENNKNNSITFVSNRVQQQTIEQDGIQPTSNKGLSWSDDLVSTDPYNVLLDDVVTIPPESGSEEGQCMGTSTLGPANPATPNELFDDQSMQKVSEKNKRNSVITGGKFTLTIVNKQGQQKEIFLSQEGAGTSSGNLVPEKKFMKLKSNPSGGLILERLSIAPPIVPEAVWKSVFCIAQKEFLSKDKAMPTKKIQLVIKNKPLENPSKQQENASGDSFTHSDYSSYYQCPKCLFESAGIVDFIQHYQKHSQIKPYRCIKCAMEFKTEVELNVHLGSHIPFENVTCKQCSLNFDSVVKYKHHSCGFMATVSPEDYKRGFKYVCGTCADAFRLSAELDQHMVEHSGVNHYACVVCKKQFSYRKAMEDHVKVHLIVYHVKKPSSENEKTKSNLKGTHEVIKKVLKEKLTIANTNRPNTIFGVSTYVHKNPPSENSCNLQEKITYIPNRNIHNSCNLQEKPAPAPAKNTVSKIDSIIDEMMKTNKPQSKTTQLQSKTNQPQTMVKQPTATVKDIITGKKVINNDTPLDNLILFKKLSALNQEINQRKEKIIEIRKLRALHQGISKPQEEEVEDNSSSDTDNGDGDDDTDSEDDDEYACKKCDKLFRSEQEFLRHCIVHMPQRNQEPHKSVRNQKRKAISKISAKPESIDIYDDTETLIGEEENICKYCGVSFPQEEQLTAHLKEHTAGCNKICSICGHGFPTNRVLKAHETAEHEENPEKPHKCTVCGKCFPEGGQLTLHKRLHDFQVGDIVDCHTCGKKYCSQTTLAKHLQGHLEENESSDSMLFCIICGLNFKSKHFLDTHRYYLHATMNQVKCEICYKKFPTVHHLLDHSVMHGKKSMSIN